MVEPSAAGGPGGFRAGAVNAARNLRTTLVLACVSVAGIIGMLLLDGLGDAVSLLLAVAPLAFGSVALWRGARP